MLTLVLIGCKINTLANTPSHRVIEFVQRGTISAANCLDCQLARHSEGQNVEQLSSIVPNPKFVKPPPNDEQLRAITHHQASLIDFSGRLLLSPKQKDCDSKTGMISSSLSSSNHSSSVEISATFATSVSHHSLCDGEKSSNGFPKFMNHNFNDEELQILLTQAQAGDELARQELIHKLMAVVTHQVRKAVAEGPVPSTQSSIISEALIKLFRGNLIDQAPNAAWLMGAVNRAVRAIIIDLWRSKYRQKRYSGKNGGDPHNDQFPNFEEFGHDLIELNDALELLEKHNPKLAAVVTLRFFCGHTVAETAQELGLSVSTVEEYWRLARAWLYKRLKNESGSSSPSPT
jgi:RNA polymerase sigma factor (TIGR02999 family)